MDRKLWKDQADSTDEEWVERQRVFVRRLSNKRNTGPGPNRLEGLNMYEVRLFTQSYCFLLDEVIGADMLVLVQRYCGKDGVRPVTSIAEYEKVMQWGVEHFSRNLSGFYHWICFRSTMMHLCHFYGYIPESFHYSHNPRVYIDLKKDAFDNALAVYTSKARKTVDQEKSAFSKKELEEFTDFVARLPDSSESAVMLMFTGLTLQSMGRSSQLCSVTRANVRLYPDEDMHEDADFGPVTMVGVSDRGNLKQDCMKEVTHWIHRTREPNAADPVFAMAMKAALDVNNSHGDMSGDLLQTMKSGNIGELNTSDAPDFACINSD